MCRIAKVRLQKKTVDQAIDQINAKHLGNVLMNIIPDFSHSSVLLVFKFEDYPTYKHFSSKYPEWFPLLTPEEFFK